MLVRTPTHRPTESLLGYVLRVSETNGYETPWHVLSHAGVPKGVKLTTSQSIEQLSSILGSTPGDLAQIAYSVMGATGQQEFQLLGHSLGKSVSGTRLRLAHPAICPHCIAEHGYIDAFFDLGLAVACPHHRCELLTRCPACNEPLDWLRPGLLTCKCGASLADASTLPVSDALADLMGLVWSVLHRKPFIEQGTSALLPVLELQGASLRTLTLKLPALGGFQLRAIGEDSDAATAMELLDAAAKVLSRWPVGFHDFLGRLSATGDDAQSSYGKRYEQFSSNFFKSRYWGKDFIWMRDEFVRYGAQFWNDSVIDHKMLRDAALDRRYVSKSELARRLNVAATTLKNWVKRGYIDLKVRKINNNRRYIADTTAADAQPPEHREGATFNAREAAAYLELPETVLRSLKLSGHFQVRFQARQKIGFHQADLDNFRLQLASVTCDLAPISGDDTPLVTLYRILNKYRFHNTGNKAEFIAAYLNGQVLAARRDGDQPQDIYFRKADVDAFVNDSRRQSAGGSYSASDAARLIGCDREAIPNLVAAGHLEAVVGREGSRISSVSLDHFRTLYVSVCGLRKELRTSSLRLLRLCETGALPLVSVRSSAGAPTSFIRTEDLPTLKQLSIDHPAKRFKKADETRTVAAVRLYLAELRTLGDPLPRRGTKPHKQAIAQACGIDRNAYYKNREIARLVDNYAASECRAP